MKDQKGENRVAAESPEAELVAKAGHDSRGFEDVERPSPFLAPVNAKENRKGEA
jgi:hypothetical protein